MAPFLGVFLSRLVVVLAAALVLAGCQVTDPSEPPGPLEIIGSYVDQYGSDHEITQETWNSFGGASVIHITFYSNLDDYLVGRNDDVASFDPGKYSRQDWVTYGGHLYYCSTAYNADTAAEAEAAQANRSDPTSGGCDAINNNPWTDLTPLAP